MTKSQSKGKLLIIGGHEQRNEEGEILQRFVELSGGKKARIIVCAAATEKPEETLKEYQQVFKRLGAADVYTEPLTERADGESPELLEKLEKATGIFLTGGDQLRITTVMAGTCFSDEAKERLLDGILVLAGTSAGAAAMSSTMLIRSTEGGSVRRADIELAPGLGYWIDTVIDTHFNQRGRVHRLLAVFALNPQALGIGLDEDTAIEVSLGKGFRVLGSGAVTVFDGRVSYTNAEQAGEQGILSMSGVQIHVLAKDYGFDLQSMKLLTPEQQAET